MTETRLFDPADPPEWLNPLWWRDRDHCDHLGSPTGAHVRRLHAAAELAARTTLLVEPWHEEPKVVDLGAGDGALLSLLPEPLRSTSFGYDTIRADVQYANEARGVKVFLRNVDKAVRSLMPIAGPVVVLTEVLEHMADPHGFLAALGLHETVECVVASSPHSETAEQHEWNHAWAWDDEGYRAMFEAAGFRPVEVGLVEWSQLWLFEVAR